MEKCKGCYGYGENLVYVKGSTQRIDMRGIGGWNRDYPILEISKMKKVKCKLCKGKGVISQAGEKGGVKMKEAVDKVGQKV